MNGLALVGAAIVAFIVARHLFRFFFEDADDFWECVQYSFTPDLLSLLCSKWFEDVAKSLRLSSYVLVVGMAGGVAYFGIAGVGALVWQAAASIGQ